VDPERLHHGSDRVRVELVEEHEEEDRNRARAAHPGLERARPHPRRLRPVIRQRRTPDAEREREEPDRADGERDRPAGARRHRHQRARHHDERAPDPLSPLADLVDQRRPEDLRPPRRAQQAECPDQAERDPVQAEVDREVVEHHPEGQPLGEVEERHPGELPPRPHRSASVTRGRAGPKRPLPAPPGCFAKRAEPPYPYGTASACTPLPAPLSESPEPTKSILPTSAALQLTAPGMAIELSSIPLWASKARRDGGATAPTKTTPSATDD